MPRFFCATVAYTNGVSVPSQSAIFIVAWLGEVLLAKSSKVSRVVADASPPPRRLRRCRLVVRMNLVRLPRTSQRTRYERALAHKHRPRRLLCVTLRTTSATLSQSSTTKTTSRRVATVCLLLATVLGRSYFRHLRRGSRPAVCETGPTMLLLISTCRSRDLPIQLPMYRRVPRVSSLDVTQSRSTDCEMTFGIIIYSIHSRTLSYSRFVGNSQYTFPGSTNFFFNFVKLCFVFMKKQNDWFINFWKSELCADVSLIF